MYCPNLTMLEHGPRRESRSIRKYIRRLKAQERRDNIPTDRLSDLDQTLSKYLGKDFQGSDLPLGQGIAKKINQDLTKDNIPYLANIALGFVKRTWIISVVNRTPRDEVSESLRIFLDACKPAIQNYLEEYPPGQQLTRLQQMKYEAINPQLNIKRRP